MKRLYSLGSPVGAMKWSEVSAKKQQRIRHDIEALAKKIAKAAGADKLSPSLFRSILFHMMRGMMRKNTWNPVDRKHWEAQGWIGAAQEQSDKL